MSIIIGLTGRREVGKSSVADHLVNEHGFRRVHPFNGGKAACRAYYIHVGHTEDEAWRMTDGDLKNAPSRFLPDNATSRFFMERFGKFMGVDMGPDWTIGRELLREKRLDPEARFVVESVVYEVDPVRDVGGLIIRIEREGSSTMGLETDRFVASIKAHADFQNNGNDKVLMGRNFDRLLHSMGVDLRTPEVRREEDLEVSLAALEM